MDDVQRHHARSRTGYDPGRGQSSLARTLQTLTASPANYWTAYAIDLTCPLVLGYYGWQHASSWPIPVASLCAGAFVFSFVEYATHRWLFHSPASFMTPMHHAHHDSPVEPSALPCITSAGVSCLLWWSFVPVAGPQVAGFFLCGFLAWYCCYGMLHHFEHHIRISRLPFRWLQRRWAEHSVHHRIIEANFGVTTSLWDRVFGTYYRSKKRARVF